MYGKQMQLAFAESPCKQPPSVNLSSGHLREPMISCAVGTTYWIPEAVTYKRELSLKVYSIKSHDGTATCSASKIKGVNCNYFWL